MTAVLTYVDSSILAASYLADEPGHDHARSLVEGGGPLVTGTITLLEVTSALMRAHRSRRIADLDVLLAKLYEETSIAGPVTLVRSDALDAENAARAIVRHFAIRALDALHLAIADQAARPLAEPGEDVGFASRDDGQRAAAAAMGFVTV